MLQALTMEQDLGKLSRKISVDELSVYTCFQNNGAHH